MALFFDMPKLYHSFNLDRLRRPMSDWDRLGGGNEISAASQYDAKMASVPTLKDRLNFAVAQAEKRLADAKEAREIFDKNPDLERLLDIMQRSHF